MLADCSEFRRILLIVCQNVRWPHCMPPPGESQWVFRWDRQTDGLQTITLCFLQWTCKRTKLCRVFLSVTQRTLKETETESSDHVLHVSGRELSWWVDRRLSCEIAGCRFTQRLQWRFSGCSRGHVTLPRAEWWPQTTPGSTPSTSPTRCRAELHHAASVHRECNRTGQLTVGSRAFRFSAPTVWNLLPVSIREIKSLPTVRRHLKTFYFI